MTICVDNYSSFLKKSVGLIGQKNPHPILFHTRFGIHTFFMRFPIDVIILDRHQTIVAMKENLKPWHFFFWNPKFDTVIELPFQFIQQNKLNLGSKVKIIPIKA